MKRKTTLLALAGLMTLASCTGGSVPPKSGGDDGERFPSPADFRAEQAVTADGFGAVIFTYTVPEKVSAMQDVDFSVEMRENGGEWITAFTADPDPALEPMFTQGTPGAMTSAFFRHGRPAGLALGQNSYEFRSCFSVGNSDSSGYSQTVTLKGSEEPVQLEPDSLNPAGIYGLWHASPETESGWSRRLLLQPDGVFWWAESMGDAVSRTRFKTGDWSVSGAELVLEVTDTLFWEGGEVVSSEVHEGGKLSGYTVKWEILHRMPLEERLPFAVLPDDGSGKDRFSFGGEEYWRLPSQFDAQALKDDYTRMLDQVK